MITLKRRGPVIAWLDVYGESVQLHAESIDGLNEVLMGLGLMRQEKK